VVILYQRPGAHITVRIRRACTIRLRLAGPGPRRAHRHPYWLRNGYVEELVELCGP